MARFNWINGVTAITDERLNGMEERTEQALEKATAALAASGGGGPTLYPDPENPGFYFVV